MKTLFLIFISTLAMAQSDFFPMRTEMLYGRGNGAGFCQGGTGSQFCVQDIERRAEADARRSMENDCRMKQGQLQYYMSCSNYCTPLYLEPGRNEYVNCNSQCQGRCDIQE